VALPGTGVTAVELGILIVVSLDTGASEVDSWTDVVVSISGTVVVVGFGVAGFPNSLQLHL
jgi:hypothetical protein